jgi:hypothetical protein
MEARPFTAVPKSLTAEIAGNVGLFKNIHGIQKNQGADP